MLNIKLSFKLFAHYLNSRYFCAIKSNLNEN